MIPSINLQYNFSKEDYAAFYNHAMWASGAKKKERVNDTIKTIGNMIVFSAMFYYASGRHLPWKILAPSFIVIIGISVASLYFYKTKLDKQLQQFLESEENKNIFTANYLLANEQEILVKNKFEQTTYQWKSIINKVEIDTHYFLFTNSVQAIIIPKTAFINNADKVTFDKILSATLPLEIQLKQDIRNGGK